MRDRVRGRRNEHPPESKAMIGPGRVEKGTVAAIPTSRPALFSSSLAFEVERVGAVAIYCSDGRYGDQMDDFIHIHLKLPRYDRLALPGGSASLAGYLELFREEDVLGQNLRFLIEGHALRHVILIAHEDCSFYRKRLGVAPGAIIDQQRVDLAKVTERLRRYYPTVEVRSFLTGIRAGTVEFEEAAENSPRRVVSG